MEIGQKQFIPENESFQLLFENCPHGILIADIETRRLTAGNPAICRMLGYTAAELAKLEMADIHPPEQLDLVKSEFEAQVRGEKTLAEKIPCLRKDKTIIYTDICSVPNMIGGRSCMIGFFNDVTEEHRIINELRKSETQYRALVENAISAVAVHEMVFDSGGQPADYIFLDVNPAFEKHTGLEKAMLKGKRVSEIIPGIMETGLIRTYGNVVSTGKPVSLEEYFDPLKKHYAINAYKIGDNRFATVFVDITHKKNIETALRTQNNLAQHLVSAISEQEVMDALLDTLTQFECVDCAGIYTFDNSRELLELKAHRGISPLFKARVSRYKADDPKVKIALKGISVYGQYSDISAQTEKALFDEKIRSFAGIPVMHKEKMLAVINIASKTQDSIPEWTREIFKTLAIQTGNALTRISATAQLARNEKMLRHITDTLPSIVYICHLTENGQMIFDFVSRAAKAISGYPPEELVADFSLAWKLVIPEDAEAFQASLLESTRTKTPWTHTFRIRTHDGALKWILASSIPDEPKETKDVITWIGTLTDITERKKAEEERAKIQTLLIHKQKMELIGSMSAGMAHEINTPIQFISDNLAFLKENCKGIFTHFDTVKKLLHAEDSETQTVESLRNALTESIAGMDIEYLKKEIPEALQESNEGIAAVAKIVKAMKEFSHGGHENLSLCDINKCVENTLTISRNEWKQITEIETSLSEALPVARCRANELNQALLNIIVNAAQAISETNTAKRKGIIKITTGLDTECVLITISDNGGGIPENIQNKIFDPFFTTKPPGKGSGQGLAIARGFMESIGGTLSFKTEQGKGTTFFIKIPR